MGVGLRSFIDKHSKQSLSVLLRSGRAVAVLSVLFVYLAGYGVLRVQHLIVHQSNYEHWHSEKRSRAHSMGLRMDDYPVASNTVALLYFPAMVGERLVWELVR